MSCFDITSFINFGLALTLLMIGNALSGAMKARKVGDFDKQKLIDGCINYILWLFSALCATAGFQIYGGDLNITIGEQTYTLLQAIAIAEKSVYIFWGGKLIQNIFQYAGIERTIDEVDDPDALYNMVTRMEQEKIEGKG